MARMMLGSIGTGLAPAAAEVGQETGSCRSVQEARDLVGHARNPGGGGVCALGQGVGDVAARGRAERAEVSARILAKGGQIVGIVDLFLIGGVRETLAVAQEAFQGVPAADPARRG